MSQGDYTFEQILDELDHYARAFWYVLMLDNAYIYPGDVRLSAYRDRSRWAVVIEMLGGIPTCFRDAHPMP
jgi:hypothetical protein